MLDVLDNFERTITAISGDEDPKVKNIAVGIKMVIGHTSEIEEVALKMSKEPGRGPDYVVIDGGDGGTGAAPYVLSSYSGLPMK